MLGPIPEKFRDQVTFFIDLERKIQDILDLGAKGEHLGRLAYGQEVFNAIYNQGQADGVQGHCQCAIQDQGGLCG